MNFKLPIILIIACLALTQIACSPSANVRDDDALLAEAKAADAKNTNELAEIVPLSKVVSEKNLKIALQDLIKSLMTHSSIERTYNLPHIAIGEIQDKTKQNIATDSIRTLLKSELESNRKKEVLVSLAQNQAELQRGYQYILRGRLEPLRTNYSSKNREYILTLTLTNTGSRFFEWSSNVSLSKADPSRTKNKRMPAGMSPIIVTPDSLWSRVENQ